MGWLLRLRSQCSKSQFNTRVLIRTRHLFRVRLFDTPMKCFKHDTADAVAICSYCGRGLCRDCAQTASSRVACSVGCAEALTRNEEHVEKILRQSSRNARASAFYCYLCAGLSATAAVVAWFMLPSPFLILFTGACAVVLFISGLWYSRAESDKSARKAVRAEP